MSLYDDAPDVAYLLPWLLEDGPRDDGEWYMFCPLHEDPATSKKASASANFEKGVWECFAGCEAGEIGELLHNLENLGIEGGQQTVTSMGDSGGFTADVIDMKTGKKRRTQPLPSLGRVQGWHDRLLQSPERLGQLEAERGLTREVVEKFFVGWDVDHDAYTIPMFEGKKLVNVKHYRLHPDEDELKIWGVNGHNQRRLFPGELEEGDVLLCEGEMDTMLAHRYGFNAVTGTGGATNWRAEWNSRFRDRRVFILYDADKTGDKGRRIVKEELKKTATAIYFVDLPFPRVEKDGQDLTDLFQEHGPEMFFTELKELISDAKLVHGPEKSEAHETVSLLESQNIKLTGRTLQLRAQVSNRAESMKSYPKKASVQCFQNQGEKCKFCVMTFEGEDVGSRKEMVAEVEPNDPAVMRLVDKGGDLRREMQEYLGLQCRSIIVNVEEYENLLELGLRRAIDEEGDDARIDSEDLNSVRRVLLSGEHRTMPNRTVSVLGTVLHHEKTKTNEFLSWEVHDTETNLDRFQMDTAMYERLKVFQPAPKQRPMSKMREIAEDLAANVTHIVERTDLHIAMDLVWHSALRFRFDGKLLRKGWLEMMVAGDTRTGKSEVAERLSGHYRAGRVVSAETATRAGLLGGSQKVNDQWVITWGLLPMSDRRLIVIDEVSGLSYDDIGQMSSVRSNGVAEVRQIQGDSVPARTRLIWMGNPRSGRSMAEVGDGMNVITELLGAPEDVARLDFAMSVSSDDVRMEKINASGTKKVEHRYTSSLCHDLVMWAWSRSPHQIVWRRGAEAEAKSQAVKMGRRYEERPPLVQAANMREKLARMAVALAARTFSTDDGSNIVVTRQHIRDCVRFLDHLYGKSDFGYRDRSEQEKHRRLVAKRHRDDIYNDLLSQSSLNRFLQGLPSAILVPEQMERQMNLEKAEVNAKISRLHDLGMLRGNEEDLARGKVSYRLTPEMIKILKEFRNDE